MEDIFETGHATIEQMNAADDLTTKMFMKIIQIIAPSEMPDEWDTELILSTQISVLASTQSLMAQYHTGGAGDKADKIFQIILDRARHELAMASGAGETMN